jgi:opacity protein-like surface antigen
MKIIVFLLLAAAAAFAADVNGKWVAQVPGRGGETREATFTFKVDGNQLTGSVTTPRGEMPISDGKIDGDDLSFNQVMQFNGNEVKLSYKGKVSGGEIKFTRQREGAERAQEFTAKRAAN